MSNSPTFEELANFPCKFPIKIMGTNSPDLINEVSAIIIKHAPDFNLELDLSIKPSTKGNYLALTANITATSKQQLDQIYLALNQHSLVKITL